MPESEDEFLCIVGKCLRKSSLKDQALDTGYCKGSMYLKYEVVYRGFTHQLLEFQFSGDSQAVIVLS
jgi:hypothetical protein